MGLKLKLRYNIKECTRDDMTVCSEECYQYVIRKSHTKGDAIITFIKERIDKAESEVVVFKCVMLLYRVINEGNHTISSKISDEYFSRISEQEEVLVVKDKENMYKWTKEYIEIVKKYISFYTKYSEVIKFNGYEGEEEYNKEVKMLFNDIYSYIYHFMITPYCNFVFTRSCNMILEDFKQIVVMRIKRSTEDKETEEIKKRYNEVKALMASKNERTKTTKTTKESEVKVFKMKKSTTFIFNQHDYVRFD